jgi:hypothetical protein
MLLIADTSVLVNFLNVDRMNLIGRHVPRCVITEHVLEEVTEFYAHQKQRLIVALADGHLEVTKVDDDAEVELFARLQEPGRLGPGECSAIAVALKRGYSLAIDDRRATKDARAVAAMENTSLTVWGTKDIIVRLIKAGVLTVEQADVLLVSWRTQHRFTLDLKSFGQLL